MPHAPRLTFVLGGARSGKSVHAEALVEASGRLPVYIATAQPLDEEMRARIEAHRRRRGTAWRVIEEPLALAGLLEHEARPERMLLVDCLTLWLTNVLMAERDVAAECALLLAALEALEGPVVLVSNEVGLGIVPADALSRHFVDAAGRLHQEVAERADRVVLLTAGIAQVLKPARG
jgi:adenosylcobinamide kinase/adenosylcobinamide-phosphate guanylyltransferase